MVCCTNGFVCRSGPMAVDNGLQLLSGGRRGYIDKKENWGERRG